MKESLDQANRVFLDLDKQARASLCSSKWALLGRDKKVKADLASSMLAPPNLGKLDLLQCTVMRQL